MAIFAALHRLSLAWKLRLTFGVFLAVLAVAGTIVGVSMTRLREGIEHAATSVLPLRDASFEMAINAVGSGLAVAKYLHRANPSDRARFEEDQQKLLIYLNQFLRLAETDRERALADRVRDLNTSYASIGRDMMAAKDEGLKAATELASLLQRADPIVDNFFAADQDKAGAGTASEPRAFAASDRLLDGKLAFLGAWLAIQNDIARLIAVPSSMAYADAGQRFAQIDGVVAELEAHATALAAAATKIERETPSTSQIVALADLLIEHARAIAEAERHIAADFALLIQHRSALDDVLDDGIQIARAAYMASSVTRAREDSHRIFILMIGLGAFLVVGGSAGTIYFARAVVRPTEALARYAEALGGHQYDTKAPSPRVPEFALLSGTMQAMARALKASRGELEDQIVNRTAQLLSANAALEQELADRRRIEAELRIVSEKALAASVSKTAFLANMSHELRTPLNAILGFSEIMERKLFGPLGDSRYAAYVADIHSSGQHFLRVINDVLDISRIELGAISLDERPVNPRELAAETQSIVWARAAQRDTRLTLEFDHPLVRLQADPLRL